MVCFYLTLVVLFVVGIGLLGLELVTTVDVLIFWSTVRAKYQAKKRAQFYDVNAEK